MEIASAVLGIIVTFTVWFWMGDLLRKFLPLMALLSGSVFAMTILSAANGSPTLEAISKLLGFTSIAFQMGVIAYTLIGRSQGRRRD